MLYAIRGSSTLPSIRSFLLFSRPVRTSIRYNLPKSHLKLISNRRSAVTIECYSASINPIDYKFIRGDVPTSKEYPRKLGSDVAGVVTTVGSGVSGLKVGDEVYANAIRYGPMAEKVNVPASKVALKPTSFR